MFKIFKLLILISLSFLISCSKIGLIDSKPELLMLGKSTRSFNLTLLGGAALNKTNHGNARPVQVCIYVLKGKKWYPPLIKEQSTCVEKAGELNFAYNNRIILMPNDVKTMKIDLSLNEDYWVVLDADFSKPSIDYAPYIFKIDNRDLNFYIHIDGSKIL